ncbi:MAG: CDP-diacylglycerol--serine O-phosphatidyltransferase [Alistipes sp.]|jgi:CDP-diacylglycerol--serine O-phosphatidyltransferase|nr:CDP-diacylglycerol--serine O-phosphatidyltransferase [Alistipes sp.]
MTNKLLTIPNVVTLANLACGCAATVAALDGRFETVFWLLVAAAVFDFGDGAVARLTGQYSAVGRELDSLADLVSFGVAPSAVMFAAWEGAPRLWAGLPVESGWAVFAVALFSALRLAKFNVDEGQKEEFTGLPTPAAGLAIASLGWMVSRGMIDPPREVILILVAVVSLLLVCPLRMFSLKFKTLGWRGNELRWLFLACAAACVATMRAGGVAAAVGIYIVASAVRAVARAPKSGKITKF